MKSKCEDSVHLDRRKMRKYNMGNLRLAISTVGDLLLNNTITQDANGDRIENITLCIPNYQRPYKWTSKNAMQLLDDILEAKNQNKETYRVGTLILHSDELSKHNIVDGQQRTITFSLLLKALGENNIVFLEQEVADNSFNLRNIISNYRTFERRALNFDDDKERKDLLEYIKQHCEFIVVITNDVSEAFQFFDSQNARGKKLFPHDLLKAYHLREMNDMDISVTEKTVKQWEDLEQGKLSELFCDYLYRLKEWSKGNKAEELNEYNIHKFKGVTKKDNFPYAQYYKGAYAYADSVNSSHVPFVSGMTKLRPFQLDTPIISGKPFFDYAKHYFEILKDIQNNDKYEGYYINDNCIVKTLELPIYKRGVGNRITRLLFDTAVLQYVDRFCPEIPTKLDIELLDQFVVFAFVWAYSLRAQYFNVGWQAAQNYIINSEAKNSFNIYKYIVDADSPVSLLSSLSDILEPLNYNVDIVDSKINKKDKIDETEDKVYQNYLHYFKKNKFLERNNEK